MTAHGHAPAARLIKAISHGRGVAGLCAALISLWGPPAHAESWGFAVSLWNTATRPADAVTCPEGKNPNGEGLKRRILVDSGMTQEQAQGLLDKLNVDNQKEARPQDLGTKLRDRAVVDGRPASAYNYPYAAPDPHIKLVKGPYGYGFNLDGRVSPTDFKDPDTGATGIDNQLYRIVGCFAEFDRKLPDRPFVEAVMWESMIDIMPAWVFRVEGANLRQGGPVKVTFDKALRALQRDALGLPLAGANFVVDGNPRSHHEFQGEIRNGVLTISDGDLFLESEGPLIAAFDLAHTHLDMKLGDDYSLKGYIGGYLSWIPYFQMYAAEGGLSENTGTDIPGFYYGLKHLADGDVDPATGERRISSAFRFEAIPAFLMQLDGKILADAPGQAAPPVVPPVAPDRKISR